MIAAVCAVRGDGHDRKQNRKDRSLNPDLLAGRVGFVFGTVMVNFKFSHIEIHLL